MRRFISACVVILFMIGIPLHPGEGRVPIFRPTMLVAADRPIDGKYVLTRNISSTAGPALKITGDGTNDVEIDLNGFTIDVGGGGQQTILVQDMRSIVIRNGKASHGGTASTPVIHVIGCDKVVIEDVEVIGGSFHGIYLQASQNFTLKGNTVIDAGANGIRATGFGADTQVDGSIEDNLIRNPGARGIEVLNNLATVAIIGNRIQGPATHGITAFPDSQGSDTVAGEVVIVGNRVESAGYRGIIVSGTTACRIADNVVSRSGQGADVASNGGDGIYLSETAKNCLVLDNVSSQNVWNGMRVRGQGNHIERNVLNGNERAGLYFAPDSVDNTFGRNTARGNTMAVPAAACAAQACPGLTAPDFCDEGGGNTSFQDNLAPGPDRC